VVAVTGDLRARAKDEGQSIELSKESGEGVLSYSKIVAIDAEGKQLAARMETNNEGDEIALVVDDREAVYPLVIDPITATLEKTLDASGNRQTDARFGFAVAIDDDRAVVGAWREDVPFTALVDAGAVYTFTRSGSTWSSATRIHLGDEANAVCGWSVAISLNRVVYGCRGANNLTGRAYLSVLGTGSLTEIKPNPNALSGGDQFGYSVAINGNGIAVGAPFYDSFYPDSGKAHYFTFNSDGSVITLGGNVTSSNLTAPNQQVGVSVALDGDYLIVGALGHIELVTLGEGRVSYYSRLLPFDGKNNNFGESVAISGNTMVVGAWGDDDRGTDAGAAYVFTRTNGTWSHQQKLTAGDGRAGDHFGEHAVAVEGNMIVVGATGWDLEVSGDNAGAAYVFTGSGTVWNPQAQLTGAAGENFGIDVDISWNTLIIGARAAHAGGTALSGAAYVYRLDCKPPSVTSVIPATQTACPGSTVGFGVEAFTFGVGSPATFQWRKNGVNISGANNTTYHIINVTAADAGSYDLVASNACGMQISAPATLNVHTNSINPTSQSFSASGSNSIVNVTSTGSSCGWTATSNASWLTITSGSSGSGNNTVGFTVSPNSTLSSRSGTLTIANQTFTVSQDAATPISPSVQLSSPNYNLNEADGRATITVNRTGNASTAATINYATTDTAGLNPCSLFNSIASQRCDYALSIGTLRFSAGETSKTIFIPIVDDAYAEGTETFSITLSNPSGVTLGSNTSATITITDNEMVTGTNPLNSDSFFVRQHYIDFLGREPEPAGLQGWLNVLSNCGVTIAPPCDRIEVSAGFFRSPEFQDRGYFVYRFYSAVGRIPLYNDFMPDFARVSGFLSAQQLEENKVAFVTEFMTRPDYQSRYGSISGNDAYVTALLNTLGLAAHSRKAEWVGALNGGTSRATVLRSVTEDGQVYQKYYNEAFVIMQYFGYLRRSADGSYVNWIQTMNSTGGDYRTMINGFLNSAEYRNRFGN
jgi:hypothetical protein